MKTCGSRLSKCFKKVFGLTNSLVDRPQLKVGPASPWLVKGAYYSIIINKLAITQILANMKDNHKDKSRGF